MTKEDMNVIRFPRVSFRRDTRKDHTADEIIISACQDRKGYYRPSARIFRHAATYVAVALLLGVGATVAISTFLSSRNVAITHVTKVK